MTTRLPGFNIATGIPTEETRVRSGLEEIDIYFERLASHNRLSCRHGLEL
jgi:hypothetical protein